jgi:hypothetical protein
MPRPASPDGPSVNLAVRISPPGLTRLDGLAAAAGLTRTEAVHAALAAWCEAQELAARQAAYRAERAARVYRKT